MAAPGYRAVIDIGSNSVLLLVARRRDDGRMDIVTDQARITGLGRGAAKTGRLDPAAVERTLGVLREYAALATRHGAVSVEAMATEGLRLAADPSEFLAAARQALGHPVRMISGDEEAELSYRSVALELREVEALRVIDIGGASTELVVGNGTRIERRVSHRIGSVRLTEAHVHSDPATGDEIEAVAEAARAAFATQPVAPHPVLYGLAGTVTTAAGLMLGLSQYDRERVHGQRFSIEQVEALRDRLAQQTTAERLAHPLLPAGRADVIVAGVTITVAALAHCGAQELVVVDRGLRYGVL